MQTVAENLWILRYPVAMLGVQEGRTVTIIRLASGDLVIHSTAPFTPSDVTEIQSLGRPAWLVDATLFHDTYAAAGVAAFPDVPYAAPEGFPPSTTNMISLRTPPKAWAGELDVMPVEGVPGLREYAFYHCPTRTLIVADLVFNFGPAAPAWTRWFFRWIAGVPEFPGISRLYRFSIRDRRAFSASIHRIMQCDFDRLIVGHGDIIESGAKPKLARALAAIRPPGSE